MAKLSAACETSVSISAAVLAGFERDARAMLFWQGVGAVLEVLATVEAHGYGQLLMDAMADAYDQAQAELHRLHARTPTVALLGESNG